MKKLSVLRSGLWIILFGQFKQRVQDRIIMGFKWCLNLQLNTRTMFSSLLIGQVVGERGSGSWKKPINYAVEHSIPGGQR